MQTPNFISSSPSATTSPPQYILNEENLVEIGAASSEIDVQIARDEIVDLWKLLTTQKSSQHYNFTPARPQFYRKNILPLPDALLEQYDSILQKIANLK